MIVQLLTKSLNYIENIAKFSVGIVWMLVAVGIGIIAAHQVRTGKPIEKLNTEIKMTTTLKHKKQKYRRCDFTSS